MVPCTPCGNVGNANTSVANASAAQGANRKIEQRTDFWGNSGKVFIHNSFQVFDRKVEPEAENGFRTHRYRLNPTCVESPVMPLITHTRKSCQEKALTCVGST